MLKLDSIIMEKFDELAEKAKKVNATQQVSDVAAYVDSKVFQDWATGALSLLQQVFGEKSSYYNNFLSIYTKIINIAYKESFDNCRAILRAAREEYEGGGFTEIGFYLDHAVLEYLAERSAEFLRRGDKLTACLLAAVLLEEALQHLCIRKGVAKGSLAEMNEALYRAKAYQVGSHQRIKDWCYMKQDFILGNGENYGTSELDEMLRGVQRFIAKELAIKT